MLPLIGARSRSKMLQRCYPGLKYKQNTDSVARLDLEKCQNVPDLAKDMHCTLPQQSCIKFAYYTSNKDICLLLKEFVVVTQLMIFPF